MSALFRRTWQTINFRAHDWALLNCRHLFYASCFYLRFHAEGEMSCLIVPGLIIALPSHKPLVVTDELTTGSDSGHVQQRYLGGCLLFKDDENTVIFTALIT